MLGITARLDSLVTHCEEPDLMQYTLTKAMKRVTVTRRGKKDKAKASNEIEDTQESEQASTLPLCDEPINRQLFLRPIPIDELVLYKRD